MNQLNLFWFHTENIALRKDCFLSILFDDSNTLRITLSVAFNRCTECDVILFLSLDLQIYTERYRQDVVT